MVEIVKSSYEQSIQFVFDDGRDQELHIHDFLEVVFVLTGTVTFEINSCVSYIKQEELFIINPYELHRINYKQETHAISLILGTDVLGNKIFPIFNELNDRGHQAEVRELKRDIARMFWLFYKDPEQNREEIFSHAYTILGILQNTFVNTAYKRIIPGQSFERVEQILRYVNENYNFSMSLADISSAFYMSSGHISRLFRDLVKMSFHQYVCEVRLHHAYLALKSEDKTVTQIAYDCGFNTASLMIDAFRKKYGLTPGKFRKSLQDQPSSPSFEKNSDLFRHIIKYAETDSHDKDKKLPIEITQIDVNELKTSEEIKNAFFELINIGWAKDLLMESIQEQIRLCQRQIGFRYLRCHGIFDDDMMVYRKNSEGMVTYNFSYVDKAYDFLRSVGLRPYVELGYTPSDMADTEVWFYKKSHICIPLEIDEWKNLVRQFLNHCIARYGINEVRQWRFTVMSALHVYYRNYSLEEYLFFYKATYQTVKEVDSRLMFGGPGTELSLCLMDCGKLLHRYIKFYTEYNCVPDFLSFQFFHVVYGNDYKKTLSLVTAHNTEPIPITDNPDYLADMLNDLNKRLNRYQLYDMRVVIECWNSTIWQRDLCNDTCYKSAFLFKNLLENLEKPVVLGYWTMSDLMEELFADDKMFHGGYGLLTRSGLPKSIFSGYKLLRKLGKYVLKRGDGYVVTVSEDGNIQAAFYNYCHYDSLSRQNFYTEGSHTERYRIFQKERIREFRLQIPLAEGEYQIDRYKISRHRFCGSAYDNWVNIGAPEPVSEEQEQYLMNMSEPLYCCERKKINYTLMLRETLEPHEVCLVMIKELKEENKLF
ncbi:GH39 family glycosyl hydrolase [Ruminococcus gauvreauii]|uniref:GH39 family glycosyl hydrolase n=1 Tax=Ruminococcus gauvreauii TaxID=438033 RepID=UPI00398432F9